MKKSPWILGLIIITVYFLSTCLVAVKENESVVIMQFGKPLRTIKEAGLTLKLPAPIQTTTVMDKRVQLLKLDPSEYVTSDRRNLVIQSFAVWRITDPELFLGSLRNLSVAQSRITDLVSSNMGATIGNSTLGSIFATRNNTSTLQQIFEDITRNSSEVALKDYGIEILAIRPNRFGFPRQNVRSIYQRMIAEQKRIATQYRAEGTEAAEKIKAETDREVRELLAKTHRQSQTILGEGEAEAARIFTEAYLTDPEYYQFRRSMDLYKGMIGEDTTLILSSDSPLISKLLSLPGSTQ